MPRRPTMKPTPSDREWEILGILWDLGSGTVAEVRDDYNAEAELELAYSTVLTYLRSLHAKGWVRRNTDGHGHVYSTAIDRADGRAEAVRDLAGRLFHGSTVELAESLLRDGHFHPRTLRRLRDIADARLATGTR